MGQRNRSNQVCGTRTAADHVLGRRRILFATAVLLTFALALCAMARVLGADGLGLPDLVLLACFAGMLPWNVIGFWNAVVGFALLASAREPTARVFPTTAGLEGAAPTGTRLALVMPVHNEDPARVIRHLEETVASLLATRAPLEFAVFLLSDTQGIGPAAAERAAFDAWRARMVPGVRLHYRRRAHNRDHKTGNLWDFLERHGARFDLMLVLDADSVMAGDAIVRLVRIMAARPRLGILQQLIVGLPNLSPFPRVFQFGMRHGMRAYSMGSAWWQGDCGPYWGHNAMVRVAPFMRHCRLPVLPGTPPLGGRILSHDQVEATFMRRAGWEVRVLPEESCSFEENPPTLPDFIKRDLRWCQGNWQYLRLVGQPGLHAMGRL
ncbi:MAG: glucans biosynthesis glucosyltransferase MdoH, partial [Geminicoccaceae bacterium]